MVLVGTIQKANALPAVIEVDFGKHARVKTLYDGTLFEHADGTRRCGWYDTSYAKLTQRAEARKRAAEAAYSPEAWVTVQAGAGIRRIMRLWGADKHVEAYTDAHGNARERVRFGLGALWKHRAFRAEREALNHIAEQAEAWGRTQGRTWLTPVEAEVLRLDRQYMRHCHTDEFRQRYPGHALTAYSLGEREHKLRIQWIALRAHFMPAKVTELLQQIDWVYDLREALGMDGDAPIRLENEEREPARAIA